MYRLGIDIGSTTIKMALVEDKVTMYKVQRKFGFSRPTTGGIMQSR